MADRDHCRASHVLVYTWLLVYTCPVYALCSVDARVVRRPQAAAADASAEPLDVSQGREAYVLYRHNPTLAPITALEILRTGNVPNFNKLRKQVSGVSV